MKPPDFWYRKDAKSWQATVLAPLGAIYAYLGDRRIRMSRPWHAPVPVICVGNLTVGGTGKTPVALVIAERLAKLGRRPVFLTRGYGGRVKGPICVDPKAHGAEQVGDEPLLLAALAPTIVARDRTAGASLAAEHGDIIVMDDGFQNPALAKDLSLLVVDAQTAFGNGLIFPCGPLREPVAAGLERAQAVILLGHGPVPRALSAMAGPVIRGWIAPIIPAAETFRGRRIAAFAGIGRPAKFFQTLKRLGATLVFAKGFPDHHPYRDEEIATLRAQAGTLRLVTTEKDFMRLKPHQREGIEPLPVTVDFELPRLVDELLAPFSALAARGPDQALR